MRVDRQDSKNFYRDPDKISLGYVQYLKEMMSGKAKTRSWEREQYESSFREEFVSDDFSQRMNIAILATLNISYIALFAYFNITKFNITRLVVSLISLVIFSTLVVIYWLSSQFKSWRYSMSFSVALIHLTLIVNIIVESYNNKLEGMNNPTGNIGSYFWYCLALANFVSVSLLTGDTCSYLTYPAILLCNSVLIIVLNTISTNYILESIGIISVSIFLVLTTSKFSTILNRKFSKFVYNELKNRSHCQFIESVSVGHCIVNEDLDISFANSYFIKNFQILINDENDSSDYLNSEMVHLDLRDNLQVNFEEFGYKSRFSRCPIKGPKKLNSDILIKKSENSDLDVTALTLTDEIKKFINRNDDNDFADLSYTHLSKFKVFKNNPKLTRRTRTIINKKNQNYDIYDVYIRRNIFCNNGQNSYEILLLSNSNCPKIEKMKVDKNYKMLLLSKISHEFKYPLMLIQNHIDNMTDNRMHAINTYESYSQIRYLAEVLMLSILDLSQYVNERKEAVNSNNNYSYSLISIWTLKEYLYNLTKVLLIVYNKSLTFKVTVEKNLENFKFTNDEKKLKQMLFNLISNSIKNTIEGEITISISQQFSQPGSRALSTRHKVVFTSPQPAKIIPEQISDNFVLSHHCVSEQDAKVLNDESGKSSTLVISIEDSGCGLKQNLIDMVNDSHNLYDSVVMRKNSLIKSSSAYTANKGLGIGLVICKKLCLELNMSMHAELCKSSDQNVIKGTKVTLHIKDKLSKTNTVSIKTLEQDNNRTIYILPSDKNLVQYELHQENESFSEIKEETPIISNKQMLNSQILDSLKVRKSEFRRVTQSRVTSTFYQNLETNSGTLISQNMRLSSLGYSYPEHSCQCMMKPSGDSSTKMPIFQGENTFNSVNRSNFKKGILINNTNNNINSNRSRAVKKLTTSMQKHHSLEKHLEPITEIKRREKKQRTVKNSSKLNLLTDKYLKNMQSIISEQDSSCNLKNKSYGSKFNYSIEPEPNLFDSSSSSHFSEDQIENVKPKYKFLVVDDNKSNQQSIEKLIHSYFDKKKRDVDVVVKCLDDGIELINEVYQNILFGDNCIKLIFCDQMMNYMNGSEAFVILNKIFKDKNIKEIPFAICSAFNDEGHYNRMKSLGIELVFEKPISYGNMEYILDSHVTN